MGALNKGKVSSPKFFTGGLVVGAVACLASSAWAWDYHISPTACQPSPSTPNMFYCAFNWPSDHSVTNVTQVSIDVSNNSSIYGFLCGSAYDGSYYGCSYPVKSPSGGSGGWAHIVFSTAADLSYWTNPSRYVHGGVYIPTGYTLFGMTVTTSS
jgi:hypothetical protein